MADSEKLHVSPSAVLMGYLQGEWIARCIHLAAILDLAGLLKSGPGSIQELAEATNTHAPSLYRLLRALACLGIFTEVAPETFAQTELSEALRFDLPGSVGYLAKMYGQEWLLKAWEHLEYSIRTGKTAFEYVYGTNIWEYLAQHPEQSQLFDQAITGLTETLSVQLAQSYNFSTFATLVDIGGGQGSLLSTLLRLYPRLRGVLFDQPSVIEHAHQRIGLQFQDRLQFVSGDFFTAVPEGGNGYILKGVLHNWPDEDCIRILQRCRQVMKPESKLLLVEPITQPGSNPETASNTLLDLLMLVCFAGQERTTEEFTRLFEASGFRLTRVLPTRTNFSIVEGVPV